MINKTMRIIEIDESIADNLRKAGIVGATAASLLMPNVVDHDNIKKIPQVFSTEPTVSTEPSVNDDNSDDLAVKNKEISDVPIPKRNPVRSANFHSSYPVEMYFKSGEELKNTFISHLLPVIERQNKNILSLRNKLIKLAEKENKTNAELQFIENLMNQYRTSDMETLIARIDIIPPSLVLAQAAVESGWGRSRLAKTGLAWFGQKTTGDNAVYATGDGTAYAAFENLDDTVESYMRNLNSHPAYKNFRSARYWYRQQNKKPNVFDLVKHLTKYSVRGEDYTKQVSNIIKTNRLTKYD